MLRNRIDRWFARYRADGDMRLLARVFDRAAPELWRVAAYLCRDRHAAEDAVQSTFLVAIERQRDWDATRPLLPWMLGLLVNRVREERRRSARTPQVEHVTRPATEPDPADAAAARELDDTLRAALARVAEPYRSTLEQHLLHDLPANEIAAQIGIAAGTVRMRLHRGLEQLRRKLPQGVVAGGIGGLLLTRQSMAAMRARVLAGNSTGGTAAAIAITAGGGAALLASNTKKMLCAAAVLATGAAVVLLARADWTYPPRPVAATVVADAGVATATVSAHEQAAPAGATPGDRSARDVVAAPTGELRVKVFGLASMEPLPGAQLILHPDAAEARAAERTFEGTTDADGMVAFTVPAGPTRVEIRSPGAKVETVVVPAGSSIDHAVIVAVPLAVDIGVVDATGTPVAGARLLRRITASDPPADQPFAVTGSDGHWRGSLPLGEHVVRAWTNGRACATAALLTTASTSATLLTGAAPASVFGTVRDQDGRPLADAGIALQADGVTTGARDACFVARSDRDGRYGFDHLPAGSYALYAWRGDGDERCFARTAIAAVAAQQTVGDVALGPGASIAVELTHPDGSPWIDASFAAVAVEQPEHGVVVRKLGRTDARGRLLVRGLATGRYELLALAGGRRQQETVDLQEGQQLSFRRTIAATTWIEVQLTDARGQPLPGWRVRPGILLPIGPERDSLWPHPTGASTDEHGRVRFEELPDQPIWIEIASDACPLPVASREVPANRRTTIALPVAQTTFHSVRGRIGTAVASDAPLRVTLMPLPTDATTPRSRARLEAAAAADGTFEFAAVPAGDYGLMVAPRGAEQPIAWRRDVAVAEHDVDLGTIAAAASDLRCRLLRSDGGAVAGARLLLRLGPGLAWSLWPQTSSGEQIALQAVPAGTCELLLLGDDCAPTTCPALLPADRELSLVAERAAAVTVRCEDLPARSRRGSLHVGRNGRPWFGERLDDTWQAYRCALPPGDYRIEFAPDDTTRGAVWAATASIGAAPIEVIARRQ